MRHIFTILLSFLLISPALAQQNWPPNPIATFADGVWSVPDEKDPGLITRFSQGPTRDLCSDAEAANWVDAEGNPNPEWKIQNGEIVRLGGGKDLFLKGEYKDFILEFEFKVEFAGNSGVYFHAWSENEKALGYEYQIIDDMNRPIHETYQRYVTASLYQMFHRYDAAGPINYGGFNTGKILVAGNHIEFWLNGKLAVNVQAGTKFWNCFVSNARTNDGKRFGKMIGGQIAFQNHQHEIIFRNVKLTELKPAE